MSKKKSKSISTFGSRLTAVISVSLVLLMLGALAIMMIVAREASSTLQSNLSVVVRLVPQAQEQDVAAVKKLLASRPYVKSSTYTSADEVLAQELENDADILEILDNENPYQAEFEVKLKPEFTSSAQVKRIAKELETVVQVDEVLSPANVAESINTLVNRGIMVFSIIAAVLLLISIVLIFNTISLSIYSRRFIIHTMQLVGATRGFIRKPFIMAGVVNGLVSGVISCLIIGAGCWWLRPMDPILEMSLKWWPSITLVLAGVLLAGVVICTLASLCATNKYLRRDYDSMFKS